MNKVTASAKCRTISKVHFASRLFTLVEPPTPRRYSQFFNKNEAYLKT